MVFVFYLFRFSNIKFSVNIAAVRADAPALNTTIKAEKKNRRRASDRANFHVPDPVGDHRGDVPNKSRRRPETVGAPVQCRRIDK